MNLPASEARMPVFGLLITKNDHAAFGDWCRDQLALYECVICLDGSESDDTARQAKEFSDRLIYRHEREFDIPHKTDHGLRRIVHEELVRRFGQGIWIMCCHTDEFCYHDPRKVAALADRENHDLVSWYSPHFYPQPSELADLEGRLHRPTHQRFQHYHWDHLDSGEPWIEDRLYKATPVVSWDTTTHGSVRPHGLQRRAPFHPIYRHFKVCHVDLAGFQLDGHATRYRGHWEQLEDRTGLPFRVERVEDLFVSSIPDYGRCDRFEGVFDKPWNIGEELRPEASRRTAEGLHPSGPRLARPFPSSVETTESLSVAPVGARPIVAIGPRMPDFGSWNWVGADMAEELAAEFDVRVFDKEVPPCDLALFVKFKPDARVLVDHPVIYAPIDAYGSGQEIDADGRMLRACRRIVIHCKRLRKYFSSYAAVEYIDHHVKFAAPPRTAHRTDGPLLWVGVRTNLPPLVEWVNRQRLPDELWILTNPESASSIPSASDWGFRPHNVVRIEVWSAERQQEWMELCRAAFDVKGDDFRARHKPPSKGIDYLASGIPLALQPESSTAEHLVRLGFDVAPLGDWQRLFSRAYWEDTVAFGRALREILSRTRVGFRWRRIVRDVLAERDQGCQSATPNESPLVHCRFSERVADGDKSRINGLRSRASHSVVLNRASVNDPPCVELEQHRLNLPDESTDVSLQVRGTVDRAIARDLWERDEYGVRGLQIPQHGTIVDIGAHIGVFTLLARRLWPHTRIIACEPDAENAALFRRNTQDCSGIEFVEAAIVAEEVSEVEFFTVRDKVAHNSGGGSCRRIELGSQPIRVPAQSVGRLWEERGLSDCDLLKLDCEGSEFPLLQSLSERRLLAGIRHIVGEWHVIEATESAVEGVQRELARLLGGTHRVKFGPYRGGREGHFVADRIGRQERGS